MPAAKEMCLPAAIMRLTIIVETDLLLFVNRTGEVTIEIERNISFLRYFFEMGKQPRVAITGEDHIRIILPKNSIQAEKKFAGIIKSEAIFKLTKIYK